MTSPTEQPLGAQLTDDGATFLVWAPHASRVDLVIADRSIVMTAAAHGYYHAAGQGLGPGDRYAFRLDGGPARPDPASRHQPDGVHAPSALVDDSFDWTDSGWAGLPLDRYVIYELHVGTFTPEGTFDAIVPHLDYLREVGITAIELMPVAQFPGSRNWGYDGVLAYAVQNSYGGAAGLRRLVDAAHARGIAVVQDVVYNHVGPEGNYLLDFGPYFTDRYNTPWGAALNFDGPGSDEVRRYFIDSALYLLRDVHIDGFRLDAVHAIVDHTAVPFLEELGEAVHRTGESLGRRVHIFPESTLNDPRLVTPREDGGLGLDAVWNDEFHHALRAVLTGDRAGYYEDFGDFRQLAKAYREGFVYTGEFSPFRQRSHGRPSDHLTGESFVVFAQNHDQVGNRMRGERLGQLVDFESLKLAAGAVLLSPYIPLLFMGEEYAEPAPFQYFISHSDPALIEAVRRGRRAEFESFAEQGEAPDPQAEETFRRCVLDPSLRHSEHHREMLDLYKAMLALRAGVPALASLDRAALTVDDTHDPVLLIRRSSGGCKAIVVLNFGSDEQTVPLHVQERYHLALDSADEKWKGPGSSLPRTLSPEASLTITLTRRSFAVFVSDQEEGQ